MNFVFISPNFPEAYRWFCIRLRENGVNVLGVGDGAYDGLHPDLKRALTEYYRVDSLEDYDQVLRALGYYTGQYGKIDWVESNNEYWLELDAALRTDFNITTGLKAHEIEKYKSKLRMKDYYRRAGLPCARCAPVTDLAAGLAERCEIEVAYAIGVAQPVSVYVDTFGTGAADDEKLAKRILEVFDLRPAAIIERLDLCAPIYAQTASYGHFGRPDLDLPWERLDYADRLA